MALYLAYSSLCNKQPCSLFPPEYFQHLASGHLHFITLSQCHTLDPFYMGSSCHLPTKHIAAHCMVMNPAHSNTLVASISNPYQPVLDCMQHCTYHAHGPVDYQIIGLGWTPSFPSAINSRPSATQHHHFIHKQSIPSQEEFPVSAFKQKEAAMISAKRIAQLAKKWQRMAALGRKRLAMKSKEGEECSTAVAGKGHCVMYTADGRRFEVPLMYLGTAVFTELLTMSQEEFGFSSDAGRIRLPCDTTVMEYILCLLRRNVSTEVENALLSSIAMPSHSTGCVAPSLGIVSHQFAICSS